jgi:hypothetical protein
MKLNIKAHYLSDYQVDVPKGKICLLLTDSESRKKIKNTTVNLCNSECARLPYKWHKKDCTLVAKVSNIALFTKSGQACSMSDLIGLEVDATIELKKYCFRSKYEQNRGEKIQGTTANLILLTATCE